ncbi:MAG: hypothetical protein ACTHZ5_03390 [Micrococcaceae bacterium]
MSTASLEELRQTLATDGYILDITETAPGRLAARISAEDGVCSDCLVPKSLMAGMIANATGQNPESIEIAYPAELGDDGQFASS